MKSPGGTTASCWFENVSLPRFTPLAKDESADVLVVGAGISGLSCAYHLAKAGKSVVVVDYGPVNDGQTSRTSAHLASAIDDRFEEIERVHGREISKLHYESHTAAIDTITEARLQAALKRLLRGRTSFVIAHRLSTVRDADQVLVMDHGRLVERGRYEELVAAGGRFAELHRKFVAASAPA